MVLVLFQMVMLLKTELKKYLQKKLEARATVTPNEESDDDNHNHHNANEIDEDIMDSINCRYFSCEEYFKFDNSQSFNILHSNVNGFVTHANNINEFINHQKKTPIDVFCVTETSLKHKTDLTKSNTPKGYEALSTETLSSKGGATILIKNSY